MIPSADDCRIVLKNKNDKRKYSLCKWMHPFVYREGNKNHFDFLRRTLRKTLRRGHQVGVKDSGEKPSSTFPIVRTKKSADLDPPVQRSVGLPAREPDVVEEIIGEQVAHVPRIPQTKRNSISLSSPDPPPVQSKSVDKTSRIRFSDSVQEHAIPFTEDSINDERKATREKHRLGDELKREWRRDAAMETPEKYGLDDDAARGVSRERRARIHSPEWHETNWHKTAYGDHINRDVKLKGEDRSFREGDADWTLSDDDIVTRGNTMRNRNDV